MSGSGGNRKKSAKAQGWEEAGAEFYQESYPMDAEFDAFQRDPNPKHIATLLPSKQNRAAATIRIRTNDNRTRHTISRSRRESTVHRRASTAAVSMLPDLSENLSNEQKMWEEIAMIKTMPITMAQKKEEKAKILTEPNLRMQGYEQFKWKRRKLWRQFSDHIKELGTKFEPWKNSLKRIEGYFGTGVVSYFIFLKYLFFLNMVIFFLILFVIVLPTVLLVDSGRLTDCNSTSCLRESKPFDALSLIQGTDFVECSIVFYGCYPSEILNYKIDDRQMYYNLPLAYVITAILYFVVSLLYIVKSAARGFKERLVEREGQFHQYCNLVFAGWDYCIHNDKSAGIKHKAIFSELKMCLEIDRLQEMKQQATRNQRLKLYAVRVFVNISVLSTLAVCGFGIFEVFIQSKSLKEDAGSDSDLSLVYEFLPSVTIVSFNILVPFLFKYLVKFERYSPPFVLKITLTRTVMLRLASIFVLYASIVDYINDKKNAEECWENYAGRQIYKLLLTDFISNILLTFFINFPRAFLASRLNNKFTNFIGAQTFDLPKHSLDVVYLQTLCWLGYFYAPLLSLMASVIFFFMFYIKKFACLVNSNPSSTIYRASRSNSMFMIVLLISYVAALVPLAYSFSEAHPSVSCGPFRHVTNQSVWYEIEASFSSAPNFVQDLVYFLTTAGFAVPVFLLLFLMLYYYKAVNSANREMVDVLKHQLVLEGHDKQFLLERLSKFIKQQQEHQKRPRRIDALQSGDTNISSSN